MSLNLETRLLDLIDNTRRHGFQFVFTSNRIKPQKEFQGLRDPVHLEASRNTSYRREDCHFCWRLAIEMLHYCSVDMYLIPLITCWTNNVLDHPRSCIRPTLKPFSSELGLRPRTRNINCHTTRFLRIPVLWSCIQLNRMGGMAIDFLVWYVFLLILSFRTSCNHLWNFKLGFVQPMMFYETLKEVKRAFSPLSSTPSCHHRLHNAFQI